MPHPTVCHIKIQEYLPGWSTIILRAKNCRSSKRTITGNNQPKILRIRMTPSSKYSHAGQEHTSSPVQQGGNVPLVVKGTIRLHPFLFRKFKLFLRT